MTNNIKSLLASTSLIACIVYATPSWSDTTVHETVTQSPDSTSVQKTVTQTTPDTTSVTTSETTDEKTPDGTVVLHKTVQGNTTTDTRTVNLIDYSNAGVLSPDEVGRMLFKIFDADGNGVIDSNEYERHYIVNFSPIEKNTVVTYKTRHGDVTKETTTTTYENFMRDTHLNDFVNNGKGISAHEFAGQSFNQVDINRDHAIDLKEWEGTYNASIDAANKENEDINTK
jgi:Ca2+-binding EF-hand superfamily protein